MKAKLFPLENLGSVYSEIEMCPFCNQFTINIIMNDPVSTEKETFQCYCVSCYSRGPVSLDPGHAVILWNYAVNRLGK